MQQPQGFPPLPPPSPSPPPPAPAPVPESDDGSDAPPKQVAQAMDRLARAARLIADIRIGADHLLEALFLVAESPHKSEKTAELVIAEEAAMRRHFSDLRDLGKQLEDSGVLNGSLKSRGNSWGLHMPLVCPDGAVVAYAWKRQLAGQAGASAVDRTRLALKAFTDQKKRFFPHLDNEVNGHLLDGDSRAGKRQRTAQVSILNPKEDYKVEKSLNEIIKDLQVEPLNVKISSYQRLDWSRRASLLSSSTSLNPMETLDDHSLSNTSKLRSSSASTATDQISVIELLVPSVFRAVVSLHPAGSVNPGAVAFFSPDEGGNYIHARGSSVHHVFKQVTVHADKALQYFLSVDSGHSLFLLLQWICSYQTLFSKVCSKCGRLLMMDKSLGLLLPPVRRAYEETLTSKTRPTETASSTAHVFAAYHSGCSSGEEH